MFSDSQPQDRASLVALDERLTRENIPVKVIAFAHSGLLANGRAPLDAIRSRQQTRSALQPQARLRFALDPQHGIEIASIVPGCVSAIEELEPRGGTPCELRDPRATGARTPAWHEDRSSAFPRRGASATYGSMQSLGSNAALKNPQLTSESGPRGSSSVMTSFDFA